MPEFLSIAAIVLLLIMLGLLVALLFRKPPIDRSLLQPALQEIGERAEQSVRSEIAKIRTEAANLGKQSREDLLNTLKSFAAEITKPQKIQLDTILSGLDKLIESNEQRLDKIRETLEKGLGVVQEKSETRLDDERSESTTFREDVIGDLKAQGAAVAEMVNYFFKGQRILLDCLTEHLKTLTEIDDKRRTEINIARDQDFKTLQHSNTVNPEPTQQTLDGTNTARYFEKTRGRMVRACS